MPYPLRRKVHNVSQCQIVRFRSSNFKIPGTTTTMQTRALRSVPQGQRELEGFEQGCKVIHPHPGCCTTGRPWTNTHGQTHKSHLSHHIHQSHLSFYLITSHHIFLIILIGSHHSYSHYCLTLFSHLSRIYPIAFSHRSQFSSSSSSFSSTSSLIYLFQCIYLIYLLIFPIFLIYLITSFLSFSCLNPIVLIYLISSSISFPSISILVLVPIHHIHLFSNITSHDSHDVYLMIYLISSSVCHCRSKSKA